MGRSAILGEQVLVTSVEWLAVRERGVTHYTLRPTPRVQQLKTARPWMELVLTACLLPTDASILTVRCFSPQTFNPSLSCPGLSLPGLGVDIARETSISHTINTQIP